jgi:hypothetical protein
MLSEYIMEKQIELADISILFENIRTRNLYLERFYKLSLQVLDNTLSITKSHMKIDAMNNNEATKYKNIIRNLHYKDILQNTKSGMDNNRTFFDMLTDLYLNNIIDYKLLTPSALFYMKKRRLGSVFSSYFFRASIMNPFLVYSLNQTALNGQRIFTPTLGWSSYCYGFMECSQVIEYVGTDVIESVCNITRDFSNTYYPDKTVDIYCSPSEDLLLNTEFLNKYREHFDTVFFSPPYYRLELYEGENQSTAKYGTYNEWLEKYWKQTIELCYQVLKPNGKMCYILSGYGSKNTKEQYDLLKDMNEITAKRFTLENTYPMYNKDVHVTKHKETAEKIMIYLK